MYVIDVNSIENRKITLRINFLNNYTIKDSSKNYKKLCSTIFLNMSLILGINHLFRY